MHVLLGYHKQAYYKPFYADASFLSTLNQPFRSYRFIYTLSLNSNDVVGARMMENVFWKRRLFADEIYWKTIILHFIYMYQNSNNSAFFLPQ